MIYEKYNANRYGETQKADLGRLNIIAYPSYYNGLGLGEDELLELSTKLFDLDKGELACTHVAVTSDSEIVGFISWLPSEGFNAAAAISAFEVLKLASVEQRKDIVAFMRTMAADRPSLPNEGLYLARIAVRNSYQGRGIANKLMDVFHEQASSEPTILHVDRENTRAIRFYERLGYEIISGTQSTLLMQIDWKNS